ncbi:MAG TPA: hypothetical protein VEJ20_10375 [Candidatus Eremiobacteraceae bacterium]|nr:hypothetical protein [Candidatus Eremiobacteraceae bacterium]
MWQNVLDEISHGVADEHLTTVADGHEAGHAIHGWPEVIGVSLHRDARVYAHAHADAVYGREIFFGKPALSRNGRINGLFRRREGGAKRITDGFEDSAAMAIDLAPEQRVMTRDRVAHRVVMRFPALSRAFDVRKKKSQRARWKRDRARFMTMRERGLVHGPCSVRR